MKNLLISYLGREAYAWDFSCENHISKHEKIFMGLK